MKKIIFTVFTVAAAAALLSLWKTTPDPVSAFQLPSAGTQTNADMAWPFFAGSCGGSASANPVVVTGANGVGTGLISIGASLAPVFQVSSSAAATDTISCRIECPTRTGFARQCVVNGISFMYGIVTTTATSESTPACQTDTYAAPITAQTASTVAGTNIPLTSVPSTATANLAAVTAGQFYNTYLVFTTPVTLNTYQDIRCTFAFGQTAGSAMTFQTPGGYAFGSATVN